MKKPKTKPVKLFKHRDLVLPILRLPKPCPIYIHIGSKYLVLSIGQRDIEFDLKTGKLTGTGTSLV